MDVECLITDTETTLTSSDAYMQTREYLHNIDTLLANMCPSLIFEVREMVSELECDIQTLLQRDTFGTEFDYCWSIPEY